MSDMPHDPAPTPTTPPQPSATPPPPAGYSPQPPPPAPAPVGSPQHGSTSSGDDNTMALLVHVSAIFTGFVGPLIIWLIKKDESPFVDRHGKTALNFQFTLLIGYVVSMILFLVLIGILTFLACFVLGVVFPIIAAIAANKGQEYTYPFAIKFFK